MISEEEFAFVESSLIQLSLGEISLMKFMQENNISEFFDWIESYRTVLVNSDKVFEHLDNPIDLGENYDFIKRK